MAVKIIVDSTFDMKPSVKQRVEIVPLTVLFGEEAYIDGVTIDHRVFYEKLVESDVLPTTSQATPGAFSDVFEKITSAGDSAVVLTISAKLSGTYQSACIAAQDYSGIYVVDSQSAAIGAGILAELALDLADQGLDGEAIARTIETERENICLIAMLDTLEYLKKGGRISKAVAFAGGLLSIKPVINLDHGEISILGKARGSKQGNNLLVQEIEKSGGIDFQKPLLLGYTGLSDLLLQKYMEDSKALWQQGTDFVPYTIIGSVIGTHAGPGAIAAAFFRKS